MPEVGEIRKGTEIGKKWHNNYIYHACEGCGKGNWVQIRVKTGIPVSHLCLSCASGRRNWKGGRIKDDKGYIHIRIYPDNFYYPMADHRGYVFEHRLVVAQHLGRCLQPWEVVHHRDKRLNEHGERDNSWNNLQITIKGQHDAMTQMEQKIDKQTILIGDLRKEIRLLRWQLNGLIGEHKLAKQ